MGDSRADEIELIRRAEETVFEDDEAWWRWFLVSKLRRPLWYYSAVKTALGKCAWRDAESPIRLLGTVSWREARRLGLARRRRPMLAPLAARRALIAAILAEDEGNGPGDSALPDDLRFDSRSPRTGADFAIPVSNVTKKRRDGRLLGPEETLERLLHEADQQAGTDTPSILDFAPHYNLEWARILRDAGADEALAEYVLARRNGARGVPVSDAVRKRFERAKPELECAVRREINRQAGRYVVGEKRRG